MSDYTAQDRANEGCCWDSIRDLCRGRGCLCDCHATTEEVLLASRAKFRREAATLEADNARLTAENAALRAAGEALAAKSPCFLTIRPTGDIECCQFCLEDNGHAAGCEWVAFVAALAGPVSGGGGEGA